MPSPLRRRCSRASAAALAAAVLATAAAGCGGSTSEAPKQPVSPEAAARQAPDGEGIAKFLVTSFNRDLLGCNWQQVLADLRTEARLFAPGAKSGLLGSWTKANYDGPPDEFDESVRSRENPPPTRSQELADIEALFPDGALAAGADGAPFIDPGATDLTALAGISFREVCRQRISQVSGGDASKLRASYVRDGADPDGNPRWVLSFPSGGSESGDLTVAPTKELITSEGSNGWEIQSFTPVN